QWILTASFGLATVAPVYAQSVNSHIMLLAVSTWMMLGIIGLKNLASSAGDRPVFSSFNLCMVGLGTLSGLAYSIDLGTGPMLFGVTFMYVIYRCRQWQPVALFFMAALPWLALHHAVNYAVGGSWKPANAIAEHFLWPGCPFSQENMTGSWAHGGLLHFLTYAAQMLLGNHGFLGHNLPLLVGVIAGIVMLKRRHPETPEVVWAFACSMLTWLVYAWHSNNYSGNCCTIRWFVPLLAQGYFVLALALRRSSGYQAHIVFFSIWGAFQVGMMWWEGPWMMRMVPGYWGIQGAVLVSYVVYIVWRAERRMPPDEMIHLPRAHHADTTHHYLGRRHWRLRSTHRSNAAAR
ncbi:MAG: hypothetical protein Q9M29_01805, partial [Mariprofundaceae bacterium]|nr:hypothetical protein [Mariprofundaceae bacterium]